MTTSNPGGRRLGIGDEPGPQSPKAPAPDPNHPFNFVARDVLRRLRRLSREVHGEAWAQVGPRRVQAHTGGRTTDSEELSDGEATCLIAELDAQLQQQSGPASPARRARRKEPAP